MTITPIKVHIAELGKTFFSARSAAVAIQMDAKGARDSTLNSLAGAISRAVRKGGGKIRGYTVTPGAAYIVKGRNVHIVNTDEKICSCPNAATAEVIARALNSVNFIPVAKTPRPAQPRPKLKKEK